MSFRPDNHTTPEARQFHEYHSGEMLTRFMVVGSSYANWEFNHMSNHHASYSILLLVGSVACFACSLFPYASSRVVPETKEEVFEASLGFPFSPLYAYHSTRSADGSSFEWKSGIRLLSWSWIPVVVGTVLLRLWQRGRRNEMANSSELPRENQLVT